MNSEIKLNEMSNLTINEIVELLGDSYSTLINNGKDISLFPSVMLWGQPGIGKSQGVRQIAKAIEDKTGKEVRVTDVRLLLFNPIDLRGIPVANEDRTLAVWLKPKIFQMDPSNKVVNILFLDEISAAPASVQAAAYQITLDRTVGEHKLPDNTIVIAAGNRVTDKSVAIKMPKALANRLLHFDVKSDFDAWKSWAIKAGVNKKVVGYLSFSNHSLNRFDASRDDLAFATPRSWEMVSNILSNVSDNVDVVFDLIAGLIGRGAAVEFRSWSKVYSKLPNIKDIFDGKNATIVNEPSVLYALCSSMTAYARDHQDDLYRIGNSIRFACRLPKDFSSMLLKEYQSIGKDFAVNVMQNCAEFNDWIRYTGVILNGIK